MAIFAIGWTAPVRGFATLYLAMFVMAAGNLAMMSIFPTIARSSGIPDAVMVTVQSLSAGISIFTTPFWAARSDRIGRKRIILLGLSGFTLSSALTAGAILIATHHLVPVAIAVAALAGSRAIFGGVGLAAMPATQAYIADQTRPEARTRTLSSLYSANGLGSIVGPAVAPFLIMPLVGLAGPQALFTLAGLSIIAAVLRGVPRHAAGAATVPARPIPRLKELGSSLVWPFVAFAAVMSGCQAANLQLVGYVLIDRTGLPPVAAQPFTGMTLMAGAGAAVAMQLGVLRHIRLHPDRMMTAGITLAVAGNLLMAVSSTYPAAMMSFLITSSGYAVGLPGAAAGASLANQADRQGSVAGLISAATGSGLLLAPVVAILLYHQNASLPFASLIGLLLLVLLRLVPRCSAAQSHVA